MSTIVDGTTGITQLKGAGMTTNDNAAVGQVGEYIESVVAGGAPISLTTVTAKTVTSISLTAGDWDVSGNIIFLPAGTTSFTVCSGSISQTNNTQAALEERTSLGVSAMVNNGNMIGLAMPVTRVSLAATTVVYLVARSDFTISTMTAAGRISARRVR
jgi:hypothetical protein